MKKRRHHNRNGNRQIKSGAARRKVQRIARNLGITYGIAHLDKNKGLFKMKTNEEKYIVQGMALREIEAKLAAGQQIFRRKSLENLLTMVRWDQKILASLVDGDGRKLKPEYDMYCRLTWGAGQSTVDYISWLEQRAGGADRKTKSEMSLSNVFLTAPDDPSCRCEISSSIQIYEDDPSQFIFYITDPKTGRQWQHSCSTKEVAPQDDPPAPGED